eukprot:scaffold827_cov369-Prasinococcus_capsulatus_cf.AAC.13
MPSRLRSIASTAACASADTPRTTDEEAGVRVDGVDAPGVRVATAVASEGGEGGDADMLAAAAASTAAAAAAAALAPSPGFLLASAPLALRLLRKASSCSHAAPHRGLPSQSSHSAAVAPRAADGAGGVAYLPPAGLERLLARVHGGPGRRADARARRGALLTPGTEAAAARASVGLGWPKAPCASRPRRSTPLCSEPAARGCRAFCPPLMREQVRSAPTTRGWTGAPQRRAVVRRARHCPQLASARRARATVTGAGAFERAPAASRILRVRVRAGPQHHQQQQQRARMQATAPRARREPEPLPANPKRVTGATTRARECTTDGFAAPYPRCAYEAGKGLEAGLGLVGGAAAHRRRRRTNNAALASSGYGARGDAAAPAPAHDAARAAGGSAGRGRRAGGLAAPAAVEPKGGVCAAPGVAWCRSHAALPRHGVSHTCRPGPLFLVAHYTELHTVASRPWLRHSVRLCRRT